MLKRILTAVLMLFVLLVVNSAGASNTVRIAYSDIDNFVGIKDGRLAGLSRDPETFQGAYHHADSQRR